MKDRMKLETIVTSCRRFAGLLAIWMFTLAALAVWPVSPQGQSIYDGDAAIYGADTDLGSDAIFSHTGLWISVMDEDGDVAYVRELRRR